MIILVSLLMNQLPTLVVCLVAFYVILSKLKVESRASLWALLGFGFVLVSCVGMPVVQAMLQSWVMQSGHTSERMWVFTLFSLFWSTWHAAIYVFLLLAIIAGRSTTTHSTTSTAGN